MKVNFAIELRKAREICPGPSGKDGHGFRVRWIRVKARAARPIRPDKRLSRRSA
jgi:hypothetical protein